MTYTGKEIIGFCLLAAIITGNIVIALRFYNIADIKLGDFFFAQGEKNAIFDPNVRY